MKKQFYSLTLIALCFSSNVRSQVPIWQQAPCWESKIFKHIQDKYQLSTHNDFYSELQTALKMSQAQLQQVVNSNDESMGVSVPLASDLLSLNASGGSQSQSLSQLEKLFESSYDNATKSSQMEQVEQELVDPGVVSDFKNCVDDYYKTIQMTSEANTDTGVAISWEGDLSSNFIVTFSRCVYRPTNAASAQASLLPIHVISFTSTPGLKVIGSTAPKAGDSITPFSGVSVAFQRIDLSEQAVSITLNGYLPVTHTFPLISKASIIGAWKCVGCSKDSGSGIFSDTDLASFSMIVGLTWQFTERGKTIIGVRDGQFTTGPIPMDPNFIASMGGLVESIGTAHPQPLPFKNEFLVSYKGVVNANSQDYSISNGMLHFTDALGKSQAYAYRLSDDFLILTSMDSTGQPIASLYF